MKNALLDTNAYNFLISGDKNIQAQLKKIDNIFISVIVIGELCVGFEGGNKKKNNFEVLERVLNQGSVKMLRPTVETGKIYGRLTVELNRKGTPIPTNDVWIAASTIETDSTLITYDRHFLSIPKLKLWRELK